MKQSAYNPEQQLMFRLQDNLQVVRKIAGWTAQELGDAVGVTRQTISNLEKHRTPMTKTQYLALRTVINHEIETGDNQILGQVVRTLIDQPVEEEMRAARENSGATCASDASAGKPSAMVSLSEATERIVEAKLSSAASGGIGKPRIENHFQTDKRKKEK